MHIGWETADLLAFRLCCFSVCRLDLFVPFPYGVWRRMWNSIVSVPGHCLFRHPLEDDDITVVFLPGVQLATGKKGRFLYVFDRAGSQPAPARLPAIALVV